MKHGHFSTILSRLIIVCNYAKCSVNSETKGQGKPNIVILLADDLGIGDIGYFGNDTINTPNIDGLCREGVKLTHDLAAASVCTPSRAALLTARYPVRTGLPDVIHSLLSSAGLPRTEWTLPKMLKAEGYRTALIGKWHLGWNKGIADRHYNPTHYGFDYFFGLPFTLTMDMGPDRELMMLLVFPNFHYDILKLALVGFITSIFIFRYLNRKVGLTLAALSILIPVHYVIMVKAFGTYNSVLERNDEIVEYPIDFDGMTKRLVNEGVKFLEERHQDKQPFFLMMSWLQTHTFMHASPPFKGRSTLGPYGDEVEEMDWSVGQIVQALGQFDLLENTIVYFSSDNGGHKGVTDAKGRPCGGWNGIFRGSKSIGDQEGGMRVPTCIRWPGRLAAGTVVTEPTSQMDIMVTLADIVGGHMPRDRHIDGRNILPLLEGRENLSPHQFLFHYTSDTLAAIRYRPRTGSSVYKLHYLWPNWLPGTETCKIHRCYGRLASVRLDKPQLYDVAKDPREEVELDTSLPEYALIVKTIEKARAEHEATLVDAVPRQTSKSIFWEMMNPFRLIYRLPG